MKYSALAITALFFSGVLGSTPSFPARISSDAAAAKTLIEKILSDVTHGMSRSKPAATAARFRTDGCGQISKEQWAALVLTGEPVSKQYHFASGCDLQGKLVISQGRFPVDLQVRHVENVERVHAMASSRLEPSLKDRIVTVRLNADDGRFFSRDAAPPLMTWNAVYDVKVGLTGDLAANSGGVFRARTFRGRPVSVVEPLKFK